MVRRAKRVAGSLGMLIVIAFLIQGAATASADEGENAQSALQSLAITADNVRIPAHFRFCSSLRC